MIISLAQVVRAEKEKTNYVKTKLIFFRENEIKIKTDENK